MPDTPRQPAPRIAGYEIGRRIGVGAAGAVYKARQIKLDRTVAVKVLHDRFTGDAKFTEKLFAEARAAAKLNHPNIVQAHDVGTAGSHYLVMEYVAGTTAAAHIAEHGPYDEAEALRIVIQIAEALRHVHARGLVHCDVKPGNIMLTRSGVAKLADLGLARTAAGRVDARAAEGKSFGTPNYQSPEQIRGDATVDHRADFYCLGATLYHMLTGRPPFRGDSLKEVLRHHLVTDITPPDHERGELTAGVSMIVEMMMAKRPDERYADAEQLIVDLRTVARGRPPVHADRGQALGRLADVEASAPPAALAPRPGSELRRLRLWLILSAGLNIVLIVLLIVMGLTP